MRRLVVVIVLVVLVVILAASTASAVSDTSHTDSNIPYNEITTDRIEACNSFASATATITVTGVLDEQPRSTGLESAGDSNEERRLK